MQGTITASALGMGAFVPIIIALCGVGLLGPVNLVQEHAAALTACGDLDSAAAPGGVRSAPSLRARTCGRCSLARGFRPS